MAGHLQGADFVQDRADGRRCGEDRVLQWLRRRYRVRRADELEQRRGLDLVIDGYGAVEVKVALKPGDRFFLETHGGGPAQPGWVFTTEADLVALVDDAARFAILVRPSALRRELGGWLAVHGNPPGPVPAQGRARGRGVWVPWHELEACGRLFWLSGPVPDLANLGAEQEERTR